MCLDYCKKCGTNKVQVNPLCSHCHNCCKCVETWYKMKEQEPDPNQEEDLPLAS